MVILSENMIGKNLDGLETIGGWECRFDTPFGLCESLDQAKILIMERLKNNEGDGPRMIEHMITPVCIALNKDLTYWEVVRRA